MGGLDAINKVCGGVRVGFPFFRRVEFQHLVLEFEWRRGVGVGGSRVHFGGCEGYELHDAAFEATVGVADVEGEAEALGEEEFGGDDVFGGCFGEFRGEGAEGDVVIFGFGGEEEGGWHEFFGVVCHGRVVEVEALEVLDGGGLV